MSNSLTEKKGRYHRSVYQNKVKVFEMNKLLVQKKSKRLKTKNKKTDASGVALTVAVWP